MEIQKIFSEIDTEEKLYSVLLSEDELALFSEIQKEFNSKAAKERNAKFFEDKGKERLKNLVKKGYLDEEGISGFITNKEDSINRRQVNSKINKLKKSYYNSRYGKEFDEASKAYEEAQKFEVGYGERPVSEAYKKLGVTKKNLTIGELFRNAGRDALKEEAKRQKPKISRGAIMAKKILREIK